jgi:uncharacterized protein
MLLGEPWLLAPFHLLIGLILGSILYRGDFCMAGILRDLFLFRDRTLLRPLLLAVVLITFFFLLAKVAGILPPGPPPTFGGASLLGAAGGLLFGIGMVLAGGCVISTLYKMAGGNLAHFVAFLGIVAGSLVYAEVHPQLREVERLTAFGGGTTLIQIWPRAGRAAAWLLVAAGAVLFLVWQRQGKWQVVAAANGYLQPWRVAVMLALLNLAVYIGSGWPIGISTAYAKIGAGLETLLAPGHAAGLQYFSQASLVVEAGARTLRGGGGPQVDLIFLTEGALMLGIVAGAFLTALLLREFRIYGLPPWRQGVAAFGGGMLIAVGARMASGCNIKHLLGGLPLLSLQSLVFVGGMLVGAWLGARLLPHIIFR